jgi:triosephosphate isomerase
MDSLLLINFKTYEKATGEKALELAEIIDNVAIEFMEFGVNIAIAVEAASVHKVNQITSLPVFSQHIDPIDFGPYTGHILAKSIKENGAFGTLLNHSEKQIDFESLKKCLEKCKRTDLKTLVCVQNIEETKKVAELCPDFIAFEDSELIGSGKSVSKMKPNKVKQFVRILEKTNPNIIPLCGAGISTREDVTSALKLGVKGVLVASAIVNSSNSEKILRELAGGLNEIKWLNRRF